MSDFEGNDIPKKPVLAVDIDEVLAHFMPALLAFHNNVFETAYTSENMFSYNFHLVWGGTADDCSDKMDRFFSSSFFHGIQPVEGAKDALTKLGEKFDLQIVTSRQLKLEIETREWIQTHFGGVFSEVHFGNHYAREGVSRKKSEICREIAAVGLIDDSFSYACDCAHAGLPVILFGDYAWNRAGDVLELNVDSGLPGGKCLVARAFSWEQVLAEANRLF
jgi:uncharacterized HAD superfamily protein